MGAVLAGCGSVVTGVFSSISASFNRLSKLTGATKRTISFIVSLLYVVYNVIVNVIWGWFIYPFYAFFQFLIRVVLYIGLAFNQCCPGITTQWVATWKRFRENAEAVLLPEEEDVDDLPNTKSRQCKRAWSVFIGSIIWAVTLVLSLLEAFYELGGAVLSSLYMWGLWVIGLIIWYLIGEPLMNTSAYTSLASDTINVMVLGFMAMLTIFSSVVNFIILLYNVTRPFYLLIVGQAIKTLSRSIALILVNTDNDLLSTTIQSNSDPFARERGLTENYTNPLTIQDDQGWIITETTIVSALIPVIMTMYVVGALAIFVMDITVALLGEITALIIKSVPGVGSAGASRGLAEDVNSATRGVLSVSCCAQAFGCCIFGFLQTIFDFIGISQIFKVNIRCGTTSGSVGFLPPTTFCKCDVANGGPFIIGSSCPLPQYTCTLVRGMWEENYESYPTIGDSVAKTPVIQFVNRGPNKNKACRHKLKQDGGAGGSSSRLGRGRKLEAVDDEKTRHYCWRENGDSWLFDNGRLLGRCDDRGRQLEGELWIEHMRKFKHANPYIDVEHTPPARIFNATDNDGDDVLNHEAFYNILNNIEQRPSGPHTKLECPQEWDPEKQDYRHFIWRTTCLMVKMVDNKPLEHVITSGPLLGHVHRFLQSDQTIESLLDTVSHSYNEYRGSPVLSTNYASSRKLFEEYSQNTTRWLLQTHNEVKRRHLNNVVQPRPYTGYRCPDGIKILEPDETLADCTIPTTWTAGTVVRYIGYLALSVENGIDIRYFIQGVVLCYQGYAQNPETDPTTIFNVINSTSSRVNGIDTGLVYCFPLSGPQPYLPVFAWSWNKFVKEQCKTQVTSSGVEGSNCYCNQYVQTADLFNYNQYASTFLRVYQVVRMQNAWTAVQYLLTRVPFISVVDSAWQVFLGLVGYVWWDIPDNVRYIFNEEYANFDQSDNTNRFCLAVFGGASLIYVVIWILWPGAISYRFYFWPVWRLLHKAYTKIMFGFFRPCARFMFQRVREGELEDLQEAGEYVPFNVQEAASREKVQREKLAREVEFNIRLHRTLLKKTGDLIAAPLPEPGIPRHRHHQNLNQNDLLDNIDV